MIIKPTGKITSIDVATITAAYGSVVSGTQKLRSMEILRASCVKIDNQSDTPICARVVHVQGLEASTGLTYNHSYTIDQEVGNYMDVIVKPAETLYIRKDPGQVKFDNPNIPTYQTATDGETIEFRLAPDVTTGTGFVYASPVAVLG